MTERAGDHLLLVFNLNWAGIFVKLKAPSQNFYICHCMIFANFSLINRFCDTQLISKASVGYICDKELVGPSVIQLLTQQSILAAPTPVIPGPEIEVLGSRGLRVQPPDAKKGLILRIP